MRLTYAFIMITFLMSCGILDEPESQPAYVIIEEVKVKLPNSEEYDSHDIRDLRSYLDGENLGVYPYPTHIACLPGTQESRVSFLAGVRSNGIASSVEIYPMFDPVEYSLELKAGENFEITPVFEYKKDVKIRFQEGFELNTDILGFDADSDPETFFVKDEEIVKSGSASGTLTVPRTLDYIEVATTDAYVGIPTDGTAVYLELDYQSESDLFIGIIGYEDGELLNNPLKSYYLGLKPTNEWKKIYVDLTTPMLESDLEAYRILFRAENTGTTEIQNLWLDNLKLLHF